MLIYLEAQQTNEKLRYLFGTIAPFGAIIIHFGIILFIFRERLFPKTGIKISSWFENKNIRDQFL